MPHMHSHPHHSYYLLVSRVQYQYNTYSHYYLTSETHRRIEQTPHATESLDQVWFFPTDGGNASQETYLRTSPLYKKLPSRRQHSSPSLSVDTLVCAFALIATSKTDRLQSTEFKVL